MNVSLVTGAGGGIGSALVSALLEAGDTVIATDTAMDGLEVLGSDADTRLLDVRDPSAWAAMVEGIVGEYGAIDRLFNVAGLIRTGYLHEQHSDDLALQVEVNLLGVMYGTQAAARAMVRQGRGHIVNIASLAGITPVPGLSAYAASKFGVRGYSLSAALELRSQGVAVTVVCPDVTDTGMYHQQLHDDAASASFSTTSVLAPDQVVKAVLGALASKRAEVTLPYTRAALARIAGISPRLAMMMSPVVRRIGQRNQNRMRNRTVDDGSRIQTPRHR
jgi:NADP-dependent 3-hydroxy acid dehydrogenase YdfG